MFEELYSVRVRFTNDAHEYRSWNGAKISYGDKSLYQGDCFFEASSLLFEENISAVKPVIRKQGDEIILFPVASIDSVISYDMFAAAFYLVTRYEEYFPFTRDRFERFELRSSIFSNTDLIELPLVNIWTEQIIKIIRKTFPELQTTNQSFKTTITIDIDQAYAFLYKGIPRLAARWFKGLLSGSTEESRLLIDVLRGRKHDPFDSYAYLRQQQAKYKVPFIFFLNLGAYSKYDKNISANAPPMKQLVDWLKKYAELGIHPSFYTNQKHPLLKKEIDQLSTLLNEPVTKSRQHYLRLFFPGTYRLLIEQGIKEDYSMGYAGNPGFRAGICSSFNWFDLQKNEATSLRVYPITWMEGSFGEDLQMRPDEAWIKMKQLIDTVKRYHGHFIPIWHNHSVTDYGFWKGWKVIFEKMLAEVSS
jgi:hypothetical protein